MRINKLVPLILLLSLTVNIIITPQYAYAGGINLRRINIGKAIRCVGKACKFVISLPEKATSWMGPVLGPIAADILTYNLSKHKKLGKLFSKARRTSKFVDNLEEQKKILAEIQKLYKQQGEKLNNQADELETARLSLEQQLLKGEVTLDEYQEKVVALDDLIDIYREASIRFENSADKMTHKDVIKMVGREFLQQVLGELKNAVIFEVSEEMKKLIDPSIISSLVDGRGLNLDNVLDLLVSGDINKITQGLEGQDGFDLESLKKRVIERMKEILKENKNAFKDDFNGKLNGLVQEIMQKMRDENKQVEKATQEVKEDIVGKETKKSDSQCATGYIFDPGSGVGCKQENCNNISDAHWSYEGYCVCGSSGSISEDSKDPNKECHYPASHESCPNCVYACVHLDEDCPLEGIGAYESR